MRPATLPPDVRSQVRLLAMDPARDALRDLAFADLPDRLRPGDLVVFNDAATLPASLRGTTTAGDAVELRLLAPLEATGEGSQWRAVLFGAGSWRARTEDRPAPPQLRAGSRLAFGELGAEVTSLDPRSARLLTVRFDREGEALWASLYRRGRPVQYSYVERDLELWSVQTAFAARPWAVEMASAGRPFDWRTLLQLRRRGIELATLTHAAGLSATGDPAIDRILPLAERYDIPRATVDAIARARAADGRVVAIGTTVVRALEGAAHHGGGTLEAGPGETDLVIDAHHTPRVVDGLLTGMHEPAESHYRLLQAFAPRPTLERAHAHAAARGYRTHEFGDVCLILAD